MAFVEKRSFLARLVIRTGLAKDDRGAQRVLLVVLVVIVALIIYINWPQGSVPAQTIPVEEIPSDIVP